jgi:thiol-disulfide isomerase/thioredoxin
MGKPLDLSVYAGKKVFLNYWATWCAPCIREIPSIARAASVLEQENFVFLLASDESAETISDFLADREFTGNFIKLNGFFGSHGIDAVPSSVLYDETGAIVKTWPGSFEWDSPEMLAELRLFPAFFGGGSRLGRNAGLLITTGLALIVANFVELGAIASVGSAVSLVVFLLVAGAGWARRRETGSNAAIILVSMAMIVVVLAFFFVDTIRNSPETFGAMIGVGVDAIVLDALCRRPLQPAVSNP